MIILRSGRLSVELARPGSFYRGSRFDWTGLIRQVTLDGRHKFCCDESQGGTGGTGLCNEFGIFTPIGYDETIPGERFPKLGVGLLERVDAKPYAFHRPYPVQAFPMHVRTQRDEAIMECEAVDCRGLAARLEKRISVSDETLLIEYSLENTGQRELVTEEYAHNFLRIDDHDVGPGYQLRLAVPMGQGGWMENAGAIEHVDSLSWRKRPTGAFYHSVKELPTQAPSAWELHHEPTGVWVREETDVPWSAFSLFGTPEQISPEAFIAIRVAPGQTYRWSRRYSFGCTNDNLQDRMSGDKANTVCLAK